MAKVREPVDAEFEARVQEFVATYRAEKEWIDEHPEVDRRELVTRDARRPREEILEAICAHHHWQYAKKVTSAMRRGETGGCYEPLSLEEIATAPSVYGSFDALQEDFEVVALELLGLLWRLEDAGVIAKRDSILDEVSTPTS